MKKADDRMRKKGMYLVTTFGAVFVIALAAVISGLINNGKEKNPGKINLNATKTPELSGERLTPVPTPGDSGLTARITDIPENNPNSTEFADGSDIGLPTGRPDIEPNPSETGEEGTDQPITDTASQQNTQEQNPLEEDEPGTAVLNPEGVLGNLRFSKETGMLPPVTGEALITFSKDHAIYHKTLDSYRTSDFVLLGGAVGSHVSAGAEGIVLKIEENERTGKTLTLQVSENTMLVYGLLDQISVSEGQVIEEGTVFATVAEPSRYFIEDGSGVFLQVLENGEAINPMLFLR